MSWYAIDAIEDAGSLTKRFLFPLSLRRLLTLGIIVFFLGGSTGGGGGGGGQGMANFTTEAPQFTNPFPELLTLDAIPTIILAVGVGLLVLGLLYAVVGSVFRFVFVDALRSDVVRIRGPFRRWFGVGLQLFALKVVAALVVVAPVVFAIWVAFAAETGRLAFLILVVPFVLVLGLLAALVLRLTVDFVVPVAIIEETGLLASWSAFWPTLRGDLAQFALYVVVRWLIALVIGVIAGIIVAILSIPFVLVGGGIVAAIAFPMSGFNPLWLVPLVIPLLFLVAVIGTIVQIPVQSYLGYYALLVLGDTNESFDLIADKRADVRGDSTTVE